MSAPRVVVGTGHRPDKWSRAGELWIRETLAKRLLDAATRPVKVFTGMAQGFDLWLAGACVICNVPFVAAIPYRGQEARWPPEAVRDYERLCARAQERVLVSIRSPIGHDEAARMLQARNEWMVDRAAEAAGEVWAGWNGTAGGTANTVRYARQASVRVVHLKPPEDA